MPDIMGVHKPAQSIRVFITFTWHNRHRIIRSMAGGLVMYLFLEAVLPILEGAPFRLDWLDLIFWLGFGFIMGVWNCIESDTPIAAKTSDFRHRG